MNVRSYKHLLCWLLIFSGCMTENIQDEIMINPFAGVALNVAVPQGVLSLEDWNALAQEWETRTNVSVEFVELPAPYPSDHPSGKLYVQKVRDLNPQLIIFPWSLKGLLGAEQLLAPLPLSAQAENELAWSSYFSGLKKNICQVDEQPGLIPLSVPTYKLFYRQDLLDQAQKNVPQSWDELIQLGKELPHWAKGKSLLLPLGESSRQNILLSLIVPYVTTSDSLSTYYDFSSGQSAGEHPGFAKGLNKLQELLSVIHTESKKASPEYCLEQLLQGQAAIVISQESLLPIIVAQSASSAGHRKPEVKLGITSLPGVNEVYDSFKQEWVRLTDSNMHRVTIFSNDGFAAGITTMVPKDHELNTRTKLAACNLLQSLIQTGLMDSTGKTILTPTRVADLTSSIVALPEELSFSEQTDILETIQAQLQAKLCFSPPLLPQDGFHEMWQNLAKQAFTGSSVEELTTQLATKNAEQVKVMTAENVRDYFRAQLGLKLIRKEAEMYLPNLTGTSLNSNSVP